MNKLNNQALVYTNIVQNIDNILLQDYTSPYANE
jgi:hypothetical protein